MVGKEKYNKNCEESVDKIGCFWFLFGIIFICHPIFIINS